MTTTQAVLHLTFITIMILLLVGGSVAILILWYVRGRDPVVGPVAAYLTEPPSDLSPGAAGTLIDENADHRDVLATLLGLGRYGTVEITHTAAETGKIASASDYQVTMLEPDRIRSPLDREVITALFDHDPKPGDTVRLGDVKDRFARAEPAVRDALYQELVDRGYFLKSPAATRWQWLSRAGMVVSIVVGGTLGFSLDPFAFLAMGAGVIMSFVLLRVSRSMPRKTDDGAEAAARWKAFRVYLKDIRKYEKVEAATDLFDRYLAYAVAFGLDQHWVRTFAQAGSPTPGWFQTNTGPSVLGGAGFDVINTALNVGWLMQGNRGNSGGGNSSGSGGIDLPNINMPDIGMPDINLQGMSDLAGGGLQGASNAFSGLLDLAGSIFDAIDGDSNS
jgi:hypothetical protein